MSYKELIDNVKECDKNTLMKLRDKIVLAVTNCFLLGNESTRKLYNSIVYYIAVLKKDYDELLDDKNLYEEANQLLIENIS